MRTEAKESVQLLPPTPSIVTNIRNRETGPGTDAYRHLNLSSPDPRLRTPRASLRPEIDPASAVTPVRSAPSASLFIRVPLPQVVIDSPKANHFNSPKLNTQMGCRTKKVKVRMLHFYVFAVVVRLVTIEKERKKYLTFSQSRRTC